MEFLIRYLQNEQKNLYLYTMEYNLSIIIIIAIAIISGMGWVIYQFRFLSVRKNYAKEKSKELLYIQIKLPLKNDSDNKDHVQNMKQNCEVMTQLYKNFYAIYDKWRKEKKFFNNYISMEMLVEKEMIKFIMGVPQDHIETLEKIISSFYPGAVIDPIQSPKILDAGKFIYGWYFTLSKSNAYPLKTYETFEADPMDSIISAFSRVESDEKLSLQILVSPLDESWQKTLRKQIKELQEDKEWFSWLKFLWDIFSLQTKKDDKKNDKPEDKMSKFSSQQSGDLEKKWEDELFQVMIRAIAITPQESRAEKIINDLARSLNQYNYIGLNTINFKKAWDMIHFAKSTVERIFFYDQWDRSNMRNIDKKTILNIKELSWIFHFPDSRFNKNPRIKRQKFKIIAAPDNIPTEWMLIWHNTFAWVKREIRIKEKDRFRHFYCIGQTGTGKSTLILVQAKEDLKAWNGFCIIDPHGELCESILSYYPKERIEDLIYFDLADTHYPIAFNVFSAEDDDEMDVVVNDLVEMFVGMYGEEIFGPRIQDYFRNAALLLMAQPDGGTMVEIMRLFTDDAFLHIKLRNVRNPVVRTWREKTYLAMWKQQREEMIPYFQAKFGPFTTGSYIRNIIWQPKSAFNFYEAMNQKKIILCNLSKGLVGEINSQLIGRMVAIQIKLAALKRAKQLETARTPFFLYVDECQNYISKSFESVLSEARKYKLWLTLVHQYIEQLKSAGLGGSIDLTKAVFGNVGNMFIYKVWAPDAEFLEKEFSPEFSQNDLVNIDNGKGIFKMSIDNQATRPFSMTPIFPYTPVTNTEEKKNIIKQISALKWWTKRELAEKEIFYRVGIGITKKSQNTLENNNEVDDSSEN